MKFSGIRSVKAYELGCYLHRERHTKASVPEHQKTDRTDALFMLGRSSWLAS